MLKHPVVVDNQVQARGTAIRDRQECHFVLDEHRISELFQSYFNNKMTLLLFLIQAKSFIRGNPRLAESSCRFLEDIYRHMLSAGAQKEHRLVFKWLNAFFRKLPDVSVSQRDKAKDFILCVYDAVGLFLKSSI